MTTPKLIPFSAADAKAGRELYHNNVKTGSFRAMIDDHVVIKWPPAVTIPLYQMIHCSHLFHPLILAAGHNPAGLDTWQVGTHEGYITVSAEELSFLERARPRVVFPRNEIECFDPNRRCWNERTDIIPGWQCFTYRTRHPAGHFLPKPPAPKWRPMTEAEVRKCYERVGRDDRTWKRADCLDNASKFRQGDTIPMLLRFNGNRDTYQTLLTPAELAAWIEANGEKKEAELVAKAAAWIGEHGIKPTIGPADFPPGTVVRSPSWGPHEYRVLAVVSADGVEFHNCRLPYAALEVDGWLRLLPGETEWRKCE